MHAALQKTMSEPQSGSQTSESSPFIAPRNPLPSERTDPSSPATDAPKEGDPREQLLSLTKRRRRAIGWLSGLRNHAWLIEILSLVVASLAFAAIVITLAVHQNRPLPQWPHLISINSLISVFTAILKAALILPVAEGRMKIA